MSKTGEAELKKFKQKGEACGLAFVIVCDWNYLVEPLAAAFGDAAGAAAGTEGFGESGVSVVGTEPDGRKSLIGRTPW